MACKIPYIDKQPLSETEKTRLEGIHVDIFDMAIASKAFRKHKNKLYTLKNEIAKAGKFIGRMREKYGEKVATLQKVASTASSEQFVLNVDVLPLTTEKQYSLLPNKVGTSLKTEEDSPIVEKYLPSDETDAKTVLETLLATETDVQVRQSIQNMLDNADRMTAKVVKTQINQAILDSFGSNEDADTVFGLFTRTGMMKRSDNKVFIERRGGLSEYELRVTLVHELLHAFSADIIDNPRTEEERLFGVNLKRIFEEVKQKFPDSTTHALSNVHEFLAALGSDPVFREAIRGTSLWSRIKRAIRKLLRMTDKFDALLEEHYRVLDQAQGFRRGIIGQPLANKKEKKAPAEPKKKLSVLEQMLVGLRQRRTKYAHLGLGKQRQQTEKDIAHLEALMIHKRNEAVIYSLFVIEREMEELTALFKSVSEDPSKMDPAVLERIKSQLVSYEILNTFSTQIRRNPLEFVASQESVPILLKQLDYLRSQVSIMREDVAEKALKRWAWVIASRNTNPNLTYDSILETLRVADRDVTWANRWLETPRGVIDPSITTAHAMLEQVYSKSDREATTEDVLRKEEREEKLTFMAFDGASWRGTEMSFTSVGAIKAEEDYVNWAKKAGIKMDTMADKYGPFFDPKSFAANSKGVKFVHPLSVEGRRIRGIRKDSPDYPLRQFYETIVMGYLKSQESIKDPAMRPGLRIPSIQRSMLEGVMGEHTVKGKWEAFTSKLYQTVRKRSDDTDFRAQDENYEPIRYVPIRYTSKQDGEDGRMSTREVSLDITTTTTLFKAEMRTRKGILSVVSDLELGRGVLAERKVVKAERRADMPGIAGFLTNERTAKHDPESGMMETIPGAESNAFKMFDTMLRRFAYGEFKEDQLSFKLGNKNYSGRKIIDALLRYTGFNIMFGNIAIPLTNWIVGEATFFKEAIGGNLISWEDWKASSKVYKEAALGAIADLGQREKKSKFGRIYTFFDPVNSERPADHLGIDSTYMRRTIRDLFKTGNRSVEYMLAARTLGAVFNRFKLVNPKGEEVSMMEGIDVDMNGKVFLMPGYTYKGEKTLSDDVISEIRNHTLRVYQLANGNYTRLDSPGATENILGTMLLFMRKWLPEGLAARWKTKHYEESVKGDVEGHYVSALIMMNGIFTSGQGPLSNFIEFAKMMTFMSNYDPEVLLLPNELELPEEQKQQIIELRKAGIRKSLIEVYAALVLTLGIALLGGDDDDEKGLSQFSAYMMARVRRELMTYMSPTTAWDVLRSPTVFMHTLGGLHRIASDVVTMPYDLLVEGELPAYKSGPYKGETKIVADLSRQFGLNWRVQFEALEQRTRLIQGGGWR